MNWPENFINKIICGDCLEVMKEMPNESIDMIMTSPPYYGLRDYGIGPDQLGLEPTPELYIEHLTKIFNEAKRVLKKEGTLWLNIGDTYSGGSGGKTPGSDSVKYRSKNRPSRKDSMQPKCPCMIPERLAWSLIKDGWILRNKIIWYKPNAMPSSVADRFGNRWEYLFLFSKNQKYYFDLVSLRVPHKEGVIRWGGDTMKVPKDQKEMQGLAKGLGSEERAWRNPKGKNPGDVIKINDDRKGLHVPGQVPYGIHRKRHSGYVGADGEYLVHPLGKNPGDVFEINTQPFPEAHFAVFPEKLCEKPIKAGCPEEVCKKCGKARERIVEGTSPEAFNIRVRDVKEGRIKHIDRVASNDEVDYYEEGVTHTGEGRHTVGWTFCNCNAGFEGGIVLDPFVGAGTALYVAKQLRRRFIGIDIKQEYCDMCEERLAQGVL